MSGRGGFALVAALWLLVAISGATLALTLAGHQRRLTAANGLDHARARLAAEAGLEEVRAALEDRLRKATPISLGDGGHLDPWAGADTFFMAPLSLGGAEVRLTLRDPGNALLLNGAGELELRKLLGSLGLDYGEADRLAQRILDWSDTDGLRRPRGAERADYLAAGRLVLPTDRSFERLSELRHVQGMSGDLFEEVEPHLTLVGSGRINVQSAPRPVLLTLPGFGDEAVAALLARRRSGRRLGSIYELALELSPSARRALEAEVPRLAMLATLETSAVEVTSVGLAGSVRVRIHALLVRGPGRTRLAWRRTE